MVTLTRMWVEDTYPIEVNFDKVCAYYNAPNAKGAIVVFEFSGENWIHVKETAAQIKKKVKID